MIKLNNTYSIQAILLLCLACLATQANSASYNAFHLEDRFTNTSCTSNDCSLREAISAANNNPNSNPNSPHTIQLTSGTYILSIDGANEDFANTGDLDISRDITIIGADANSASTIITAKPVGGQQMFDRIFHVRSGFAATLTLQNLTLSNGLIEDNNGGAIYVSSDATLVLDNVVVKDSATDNNNIALAGLGGGIYNDGTLTIKNGSVITNNIANVDQEAQQANLGGGGLYNSVTAKATITQSTFTKNSSFNQYTPTSAPSNFNNYSSGGAILNLGTMRIERSTIGGVDPTNANQSDSGAGVSNIGGFLTITKSTISYNQTSATAMATPDDGRTGAGVFNQNAGENRGSLLITATTISKNISTKNGGGIFNSGSPLTLTHSTVSDNTAAFQGGGIVNLGNQSIEISNSTIAYNRNISNLGSQPTQGGGLYTSGRINITSTTIAGNEADAGAQLLLQDSSGSDPRGIKPQVTLANTVIDNNSSVSASDLNCSGNTFIVSLDYNIDSGNSCGLNASNDQISTNPLLATTLEDNPGTAATAPPTKTLAFISFIGNPSHPTIDQRQPLGCPSRDQRYYSRVSNCDLGAYEEGGIPGTDTLADLKVTVTDSQDPGLTERQLVYTITATNIGPDPSPNVRMRFTADQAMSGAVAQVVDGDGICYTSVGVYVTCDLGLLDGSTRTLAAFETTRVSVTLTPTTAGTLTATATVASLTESAADYFTANNTFTKTTTIFSINNCSSSIPGCPPFASSPGGGGGSLQPLSLLMLLSGACLLRVRRIRVWLKTTNRQV